MRATTLVVLAALATLPTASSATTVFAASGSFAVGEPIGYLFMDACGWEALEGVNSNCVALPSGVRNHKYSIRYSDPTDTLYGLSVCFYDGSLSVSVCDPASPRVPSWATYMSVSALGGANVAWRFHAYS